MAPPKTCPECGVSLAGLDPYKHALACFHLAPGPVANVLAQAAGRRNEEQLARVKELLGVKE